MHLNHQKVSHDFYKRKAKSHQYGKNAKYKKLLSILGPLHVKKKVSIVQRICVTLLHFFECAFDADFIF